MGTGSLACSCLFASCSTLQFFLLVSQVKTDFNMVSVPPFPLFLSCFRFSVVKLIVCIIQLTPSLRAVHILELLFARRSLRPSKNSKSDTSTDLFSSRWRTTWRRSLLTLKAVQVTAGINSCPLFLKTTADTLFTISSTTKAKDNETRFSWLFGLLTLPESNPRCCTPPQRTPSRRSWLELALEFKLLTCLKSTTKPFLIRLFEFK